MENEVRRRAGGRQAGYAGGSDEKERRLGPEGVIK